MALAQLEYEVVGFRPYSLTDERTGELLEGISVYCNYSEKGSDVVGRCAEKLSVKAEFLDGWFPKVGQVIEPVFNRRGRCVGVSVLSDVK